ncbi:methyltransferase [Sphingobium sp. 3R8]|uniref:class I SAM-dependent methyltransferase n=1 Tax=Sphingobium sp. 3R8 TaxID=2874921 RepID=UPI001CCFAB8F|nr:methyltransferase domain-containing protein [Sphingobium sp. 3R8]MBZ9647091.1 methyltransferase [Sphingobium sp. 3R8]
MREMLETGCTLGAWASQPNAENMGQQGRSLGLSIKTFFQHPMMVGSAFPASRWLVRHMLAPLDWQKMKLLVEFGPGTGVFTRAALALLPADATLLALDTSPAFIDHLRASIQDQRLQAVCAPAVKIATVIKDRGLPLADCILSGLPFSTLDPMDAERTAAASRTILGPEGIFCAYQMRRTIEPLLKKHIGGVRSAYEWRNIPPCHLYWVETANPEVSNNGEKR